MAQRYDLPLITVGDLKRILRELPDTAAVSEEDYDTAHLAVHSDQIQVDGGHLVFTPSRVAQDREDE